MNVNKSVPKKDGVGLILGRPAYTDDLADKNSLIVKVLRSPHAHARIRGIDADKAKALVGISCVLTREDVPDKMFTAAGQGFPEPAPYDRKILDEVVRYIGDVVCIVAGVSDEVVDRALDLIKVDYEVLPAILDYEKALDNDIKVHNENGTFTHFDIGHHPERNLSASYSMEIGDVKKVLSECEHVFEGRYYTQAQAHAMTEAHSVYTFMDFQGRLNVISSTQVPFHIRRIIARTLGLGISDVRVTKPRIGGGFGGKQIIHGELFTSLVTLKTGQPAKMVYSRKEVFEATTTRHPMRIDVKIGADSEGNIKVMDMAVLSNTGAYGEHGLTVLMVSGAKSLPLYNRTEAVAFRGDVVYTNLTPSGALRGYGAIQGNFALESAIDDMARMVGMDPVEFRRKNMIKPNETSKIFEVMGEGKEGTPMVVESCGLEDCIDECKKRIGWDEKYPFVETDDKIRSVGMAIAMQGSGIPHIDLGSATIKLNDGGFYNLNVGATDIGTGSDTILAQIAADVLMTSVDKVITFSSDTDLSPMDSGAYASSTTYISGNAVLTAAENMVNEIIKTAAGFLGTDDVDFDGTFLSGNGKSMTLAELADELFYTENQKQLIAHGSFVGDTTAPPYMAGACEIEIDKATGQVKVLDYIAAVDCGTLINPNLAKIQVEGAITQGIGMALYEEAKRTSRGNLVNNSFLKYRVPTRQEIGNIDVVFVETYEPTGPFGAKSVGEIGIDTPPAAIANAIMNATGKRLTTLPILPEDVWKALVK